MKKLLGISFFALLAVAPMVANADAVAGSPVSYATQPTGEDRDAVLGGQPLYQLAQSAGTDVNAASAGYVKGAYNAAIKAVNKVAAIKQDVITVSQGTGSIVTGVSLNNDGKTVSVTKSYESTVPVSSSNSSTRANIWVE